MPRPMENLRFSLDLILKAVLFPFRAVCDYRAESWVEIVLAYSFITFGMQVVCLLLGVSSISFWGFVYSVLQSIVLYLAGFCVMWAILHIKMKKEISLLEIGEVGAVALIATCFYVTLICLLPVKLGHFSVIRVSQVTLLLPFVFVLYGMVRGFRWRLGLSYPEAIIVVFLGLLIPMIQPVKAVSDLQEIHKMLRDAGASEVVSEPLKKTESLDEIHINPNTQKYARIISEGNPVQEKTVLQYARAYEAIALREGSMTELLYRTDRAMRCLIFRKMDEEIIHALQYQIFDTKEKYQAWLDYNQYFVGRIFDQVDGKESDCDVE